ncbi:hypothetical protein JX009_000467 [Listeria monocytogenes]|uniref:protein-export chaperone SecB n=1 Tax=Listeria monocytogenes TaxID=1639 RepID=UPI000873E752|nr:protein-export chaperone SecB [Listeria monocytogenes]EAC3108901.1 hypothetical protein [Listeria monocytogenes]EAC7842405.1 hypothetical protein [Listeria monocytogenes]EAD3475324.1 hypothetical protein [Listeria monocytogenes]EAD5259429.1 hypothetical protein [Listeria monocytogenes]EDB3197039.1 hypothetical protein [Listeria monocytogenes]
MELKNSKFEFENPVLTEIDFKINKNFIKENIDTNTESASGSITVKHKDDIPNEAFVYLNIIIGQQGDSFPFELKLTMGSNFKWPEGIDENNIESLLTINAPALLLSYIRPIVSSITSSSAYPTYYIPFIDFANHEMTPVENNE